MNEKEKRMRVHMSTHTYDCASILRNKLNTIFQQFTHVQCEMWFNIRASQWTHVEILIH